MKESTILLLAAGGLGIYLMTRQQGVVSLPAAPVIPGMPTITMPEIVVNVPQATGAGGLDMQGYIDELQRILRDALQARAQPAPTGGSYIAPPGTPMGAPPPGAPVNPPSPGNPWGIRPGDVWSYPDAGSHTPVSSRATGKAGNTQNEINQLQQELARLGEQLGASWNRATEAVPHQIAPPSLQGLQGAVSGLGETAQGYMDKLTQAYSTGWTPQGAATKGFFGGGLPLPDTSGLKDVFNKGRDLFSEGLDVVGLKKPTPSLYETLHWGLGGPFSNVDVKETYFGPINTLGRGVRKLVEVGGWLK